MDHREPLGGGDGGPRHGLVEDGRHHPPVHLSGHARELGPQGELGRHHPGLVVEEEGMPSPRSLPASHTKHWSRTPTPRSPTAAPPSRLTLPPGRGPRRCRPGARAAAGGVGRGPAGSRRWCRPGAGRPGAGRGVGRTKPGRPAAVSAGRSPARRSTEHPVGRRQRPEPPADSPVGREPLAPAPRRGISSRPRGTRVGIAAARPATAGTVGRRSTGFSRARAADGAVAERAWGAADPPAGRAPVGPGPRPVTSSAWS